MSFILEALKKSDKKRQTETVPKLQSEHEAPVVPTRRKPIWLLFILLGLLLSAAAFGWFLGAGQEQALPAVDMAAVESSPAAVPEQVNPVSVESRLENAQRAQPLSEPVPRNDQPAGFGKGHIYLLEELPSSVRGRLPALHMALHAYSQEQPAASLVRINNQILREGSELAGGFVLQEITAEGALLSYQGYRFLLQRKNTLGQ